MENGYPRHLAWHGTKIAVIVHPVQNYEYFNTAQQYLHKSTIGQRETESNKIQKLQQQQIFIQIKQHFMGDYEFVLVVKDTIHRLVIFFHFYFVSCKVTNEQQSH